MKLHALNVRQNSAFAFNMFAPEDDGLNQLIYEWKPPQMVEHI